MNHQGSGLIGRIAQWVLIALGVLFTIMILSGSDVGIDGGLWVAYIAFSVAALSTILFSAKGMTRKSLLGIAAFLALLFLAYLISDGSVQPGWNVTESTSKWIGAGLILMYVSLFGAIAAIVYGEITRIMK